MNDDVKTNRKDHEVMSQLGRPTKLTPEAGEAICKALRDGCPPEVAAESEGVARSTYYLWLQLGRDNPSGEHAAFLDGVTKAVAAFQRETLAHIRSASREKSGEVAWQAAAWILERRWPALYGLQVKQTVAEAQAEMLAKARACLPDDHYQALLRALSETE